MELQATKDQKLEFSRIRIGPPSASNRPLNLLLKFSFWLRHKPATKEYKSATDFIRLGTHFNASGHPILGFAADFYRLKNRKVRFQSRVHDFREKTHILERRLCRSGGQPSQLIVCNAQIKVSIIFNKNVRN
jgi:hypothetical protein